MADNCSFLFVGSASYSNRGCEAIVRGTVDILSNRFPGARFIISSSSDEDPVNARSEIDPRIQWRPPRDVSRWSTPRRLFDAHWWWYRIGLRPLQQATDNFVCSTQRAAAGEAMCTLQVGGDNYTLDYGPPDWLLRLDRTLHSTGKPLVLWGASVGPFARERHVEERLRDHLMTFDLICARESMTLEYLASLGVTDNVKLVADPAFVMTPVKPDLSEDLEAFLSKRPVGVNLSEFAGKFRNEHGNEDWHAVACGCVKALVEADLGPLLLVPHVFKEGNDDHLFLEDIAKRIEGWGERILVVPPGFSAQELKWIVSNVRVFAGARTHSTIAAISSCVPTVSIGYSYKATGINKDIFGDTRWIVPVGNLRGEVLVESIRALISEEESVRAHLQDVIPKVQQKSRAAAEYVAALI
jgi:colanic acid/amylovoran biosynthesis protein